MAKKYYDYASSRCGDARCNNGWYNWNGSEYPCSTCIDLAKAAKEQARLKKNNTDSQGGSIT